jgi:hypothetical protein
MASSNIKQRKLSTNENTLAKQNQTIQNRKKTILQKFKLFLEFLRKLQYYLK